MTLSPSATFVVEGVTLYVGTTSLIVIDGVVVSAAPEVEPVLITILKFSDPSVPVASATSVLVNVAIPVDDPVPTTLNDPVRVLSVKSAASALPPLLKYNVEPFGTFVVLTVNSTDCPSFTLVVHTPTVADGTRSLIIISLVNVTAVPEVEPVLITNLKVSGPSVRRSDAIVLVTVPIPPVAVPSPTTVKLPVRASKSLDVAELPAAPTKVP